MVALVFAGTVPPPNKFPNNALAAGGISCGTGARKLINFASVVYLGFFVSSLKTFLLPLQNIPDLLLLFLEQALHL